MTATSVDWRNRFTWNWLTNIKDKGGCGSCYIFSGIGVVEAMLRIEHAVWSCRSEGDPGDSISLYFGTHGKCEGGSPAEVLDWVIKNGVADPGCWPYVQGERTGTPTADRLGRTGKLDGYVWLSGAANMKGWLDANGPISACFSCYPEFDSACQNNSVYIYKNPNNDLPDGHCIVIVGYDDAKKAWLIRNSWGIGWGTGGYGWFGYGQGVHGLENWSSLGILGSATNPDPWTKRRKHNGVLYESGNGANHRNFEVWTPGPGGIIRHYYRDGGTLNWTLAETLPQVGIPNVATAGYDCYGVPSATGSTYFRNFEVIYQAIPYEQVNMQYTVTPPVPNGKPICQLRHYLYDQLDGKWTDRGLFGPSDTGGIAGFTQVNTGAPGNFEVVVRRDSGVLENWWRDNAGNTGDWAAKATFGSNILLSGATLAQRWATNGELGVNLPAGLDYVCVTGGKVMQRWFRDDINNKPWAACETFGANVESPPVMIRSEFGASSETVPGNYELCVAVNGMIEHWWTPGNPEPGLHATWIRSASFSTNQRERKVKQVLGLVEGSFGFNLEVVAELDNGGLQHFYRDGSGWQSGPVFGTVN
jgi:hypothetical protein